MERLYAINDALSALAAEYQSDLADDELNELTHYVADKLGVEPLRSVPAAKRWVTDKIRDLFYAEIANERHGGVTPATVSSTIDSISQASDIMCEDWYPQDFASLLLICDLVGTQIEVRDLL